MQMMNAVKGLYTPSLPAFACYVMQISLRWGVHQRHTAASRHDNAGTLQCVIIIIIIIIIITMTIITMIILIMITY